jgi:hypothetical protein
MGGQRLVNQRRSAGSFVALDESSSAFTEFAAGKTDCPGRLEAKQNFLNSEHLSIAALAQVLASFPK